MTRDASTAGRALARAGRYDDAVQTSLLRRLDPERDSLSLHQIYGDTDSCRYLLGPAQTSVEETLALLRDWTSGTEDTSWAIVEAPDGDALGRISLIPRLDGDVWEAAVMLRPDARGRALALRGMREALAFIFEEKKARRVFADIDPDNLPCIRLFERLDFEREGYHRAMYKTHLGIRDAIIMAKLGASAK